MLHELFIIWALMPWYAWGAAMFLLFWIGLAVEDSSGGATVGAGIASFVLLLGVSYAILSGGDQSWYVRLWDVIWSERTLGVIAWYVGLGAAWAYARWLMIILKVRVYLPHLKAEYERRQNDPATADQPKSLNTFLYFQMTRAGPWRVHGLKDWPIKASAYRQRAINQMAFWPADMLWYIAFRFLREVFSWIWSLISGFFQLHADWLLRVSKK